MKTTTTLALISILYSLTFLPFIFSSLESYSGELDSYKPLLRVILSTFLSVSFIDEKLYAAFFVFLQVAFSTLLLNLFFTYNILGEDSNLSRSTIEALPFLLLCVYILRVDEEEELANWEPPTFENLSENIRQRRLSVQKNLEEFTEEAKHAFEEKSREAKETLEEARERVEKNLEEAKESFEKNIDEAKKFVKDKIDNIDLEKMNHDLIPEALNVPDAESPITPQYKKPEKKMSAVERAKLKAKQDMEKRLSERVKQLKK
eukprot:snap_masked-scaffold_24-processed-gene-1.5-mRNA-1 protein AED:1.00 eAED:1.00 QI:0/0/0/0/1/1/2/0/260